MWAAPADIAAIPAPMLGSDPPKAKDIRDGDASVSTQTGALSYAYPISVPPGRMGMEPKLALSYSSQGAVYGGIADHWSLSIPEIRLDTSESVLDMTYFGGFQGQAPAWQREKWVSTLSGGRPLVPVTEPAGVTADVLQAYRAQNDDSYVRYERVSGLAYEWRARGTNGLTYYFGETSLVSGAAKYVVPLTSTEDRYGNRIEYQWADQQLVEVRYTSNPAAGLPAFAKVQFDYVDEFCAPTAHVPIGAAEDGLRGIKEGRRKLTKIRAIAIDSGGVTQHTREYTLGYDAAAASCTALHGPQRLLTSIQESAWRAGQAHTDLPAVTFTYNRLERTFDDSRTQPVPWPSYWNQHNTSYGERGANEWSGVRAMLLDFDGDGLQDRVESFADTNAPNECKFVWFKNLGRDPGGNVSFAGASTPYTMPRLPWGAADGTQAAGEHCFLNYQVTRVKSGDLNEECTTDNPTYLAYRWLDLNADGRVDLVAAIHQDFHFDASLLSDPVTGQVFNPDLFTNLRLPVTQWPSCLTPLPDGGACRKLEYPCLANAMDCSKLPCTVPDGTIAQCMSSVGKIQCGELQKGNRADCPTMPGCGSTHANEWVPGGSSCGKVSPHQQCARYPWFVYWNEGGVIAPTGQIKYQPVPLESDNGDSPAGGGGAVFSETHAVTDIDGDGYVDVAMRGADLSPEYKSPIWWLVFRGDGTGDFKGFQGGDPYVWLVPDGATVMGSCERRPLAEGLSCDPSAGSLSGYDRDLRGHSSLIDLNGDGATDYAWVYYPDDPNSPWPLPTTVTHGFFSNGRQFGNNSATTASGETLGAFDLLSRAYVHPTDWDAVAKFMRQGDRVTADRMVDLDGDGRVDLVRTTPGAYTATPPQLVEAFMNDGGTFHGPVTLPTSGNNARSALVQRAEATIGGRWGVTNDYVDLDGDGLGEGWSFTPGAPSTATIVSDKDTQPLRLLKAVTNGRGATVTITYAPTTDATTVTQDPTFVSADRRKAIPNVQWVVKSMSTFDQWDADVSTTSYAYKHPIWAKDDRGRWGFRGFEEVTTTLPPAASGSAKSVDTYDYAVDWSGRLATSRKYSAEEPANPRSISETTWAPFTLFNGAIKTYHATHQQSWTCNNGQSEATCRAAYAGYVWKYSIWTALSGQLWVEDNTYTMDGPAYNAGDRRSYQGYVLYSTPTAYQVQQQTLATLLANNGNPAQDTWTNYVETYFDSAYKQPTFQQQFFAVNAAGTPDYTTRAITTWTYDPATGVKLTTQNPRNNPSGPVESYSYDANKRFVISSTNELGHLVTATYEPGTGAQLTKEGPNGIAPNNEKTWTDVDGIGRPVATYVNRDPGGGAAWQKTLVAKTTYFDAIGAGLTRTKVVAESLIDWGGFRWTREETRLDGKGRPAQVIVKTGGTDAITTYDYDKTDHLVAVSLPDPRVNSAATVTYTYAYDSLGRPTAMRRPGTSGAPDSGVNMSYNGQTSQTDEVAGALGGVQARKVLINDHFGRLVEVREYTSTAGVGSYASTFYQYDGGDRVTRIQNPDTVITELFHDFAGRRVKITRGSRNWFYTYLKDGQLESETVPGQAGTTTNTYGYDSAGRMTSRLVGSRGMASGAGSDQELFGIGTTTFTYDTCTNGKARLCTVTLPNSRLVTAYAYDSEGNTTDVTRTFNFGFAANWSRTTSAAFGPRGKLVTQKYADEANGQTVKTVATYNYDDRANPAVMTWTPASGGTARTVANQTRNVAGLVTQRSATLSATSGWKNFASDFTYDVLTRVASQTVKNATANSQLAKQQLDYFGSDDPARLRHWMGTTAYDFTYGYDLLHELTSVSEASNPSKYTATFAYGVNGTSGSGKFKSATVATQAGLAGSQVTPRNVTYDYTDARDPEEPTGLTNVGTGTRLRSYVYDDAGNQIEVHSGAVANPPRPTTRFVYDGDDQLRRATTFTPGTTTVTGKEEYYYDHDGHRVGVVTRNAAGTITKTRLFIGDSEVELTAANTIGTAYSYLSMGTPVAKVVSPTGGWTASNTTWANNVASLELQYHGLSSNTLVSVNAGGVVQSAFVYAPYGDVVQASGATTATIAGQRRRFNDKFRDDLTGLSYYGVRYYDGLALGWTQADPMYRFAPDAAWAEPRRAGLYQSDLGNPVRYMDPDGRDPDAADMRNNWEALDNPDALIARQSKANERITSGEFKFAVLSLMAVGVPGGPSAAFFVSMAIDGSDEDHIGCQVIGWGLGQGSSPGSGPKGTGAGGAADDVAAVGTKVEAPAVPTDFHLPGDVPDNWTVVRGGASPMPAPGTVFSASMGADAQGAAAGVPHGQIRTSTAGAVRAAGGDVRPAPEATRSGNVNGQHVNVTEAGSTTTFGDLFANPVPKPERIN
ncbi:MAG: hypothetical protein IPH80_12255 [Myxococcales bacterium]|nr:hypothetical protein [Myxococcales bacterium]